MASNRSPALRRDEGRRADLVDAALRVIARDGVAAATTRRIADEAGVPLGTLHYWFAGKDELLEQVVSSVLDQISSATLAVAYSGSMADRLRAAWRVITQDDPGRQLAFYELTAHAIRDPELRHLAVKQYSSYRATAADLLRPWLAEHPVVVPGGSEALAELIADLFDGMVLSWLADPDGVDPDRVFALIDHLVSRS
jgi:DNA-binding transcriptional regulator YbjK